MDIENFSTKEDGLHNLKTVLTFLESPRSGKVLETMFNQKEEKKIK